MPIYFLNLRAAGEVIRDLEGFNLADLESARVEAIAAAREMIAEQVRRGEPVDDRSFEITDATGTILNTVAFKDVARFE